MGSALDRAQGGSPRPPADLPRRPHGSAGGAGVCNRCGFPVPTARAWGCKNPCPNCHTVYPLGDCSD